MQRGCNLKRGRPPKQQVPSASFEYAMLIIILIMMACTTKILADFYIFFTNPDDEKPLVQDPIGFVKCPKNKKSEGLYCPIYPQRR